MDCSGVYTRPGIDVRQMENVRWERLKAGKLGTCFMFVMIFICFEQEPLARIAFRFFICATDILCYIM